MSLSDFSGAIAGAGDGAAMAAVVEQRVHGFLQHALFVADDDFRRLELEQVLQPVIAVDDAAIEIVQIGRRETSAFERHERTQVRRNHRQHVEDHPFRTALAKTAKPWSSLMRLAIFLRICLLLVSVIAICSCSICFGEIDLAPELRERLRRPSWRGTLRRRRFRGLRGIHVR